MCRRLTIVSIDCVSFTTCTNVQIVCVNIDLNGFNHSSTGSTIRILKPELWMEFLSFDSLAGETVAHKFKPGDNVLSVKGFAVDRIKVMRLWDTLFCLVLTPDST